MKASRNGWHQRQGMQAYVQEMEHLCAEMASMGRGLTYAEAWRRHSHLGFCPGDFDPLPEIFPGLLPKAKTLK